MIINLRGTNGAGKSHCAQFFTADAGDIIQLASYKTKAKRPTIKAIPGYINGEYDICVVGSYKTQCGGMDSIPNFELAREAITKATKKAQHVLCEGILASTVYGSWAEFADTWRDDPAGPFAFVYLTVPLEECLRRIRIRNGGKPINEKLVADKVKSIDATRLKALEDGHRVYVLPEEEPEKAILKILNRQGKKYRQHCDLKGGTL